MGSRALKLKLQEAERQLASLKENAASLQDSVLRLEEKIGALQRALNVEEEEAPQVASPPPLPKNSPPPQPKPAKPQVHPEPASATPSPTPEPTPASVPEPAPLEPAFSTEETELPSEEKIARTEFSTPEPPSEPQEALEMRFGRVWFVRIGIGLVLTGFVFLSTYTYKNYIAEMGPAARIAALFTGALLLTTVGIVLERWSEALRNYGRVVTAGGGAAVYYTTYAAHHIEHLRVIESPVLAAVILSLVALVFFAYAASRKSSVLTVGSLILAFYATAINPAGWLGCFSSLLLSGIGIFFFLRCGWARTGITGLLGAYLSYTYWQGVVADVPADDYTRWFLVGYWLLFTCAFLSSSAARFSSRERSYLLALNNLLFFGLFTFQFQTGSFVDSLGTIALVFGAVLLGISLWIARRPDSYPSFLRDLYLAKGLTLLTWGITLELSGYWLFLTLTMEAAALAFCHWRTKTPIVRIFSWLAASGGAIFALTTLEPGNELAPLPLYVAQGILFVGIAYFLRGKPYLDHPGQRFSLESVVFVCAAIGIPALFLSTDFALSTIGLGLLGLSVLLLLPYVRLGEKLPLPELSWVAQAGGLIGTLMILSHNPPTWQFGAACALAATSFFFLGRFQDRELIPPLRPLALGTEYAFTTLAIISLGTFVHESVTDYRLFFVALTVLPLVGSLTASKLGREPLSQLILGCYVVTFALALHSWSPHDENSNYIFDKWVILTALLIVIAHLVAVQSLPSLAKPRTKEFLLGFATFLWIGWCVTFVSMWWLVLTWTGFALVLFSFRNAAQIPSGLVLLFFGLVGALVQSDDYWFRYLALPAPFLFHLLGSRRSQAPSDQEKPPADVWPILAVIVAAAWTLIASQHTLDVFEGDGLAVCWALLGPILFALGLGLRVRAYRLSGLTLLALCLGHVLLVDVWELDPVPRIVSFLTLGLALLALGFVYNRWQETLRKLL